MKQTGCSTSQKKLMHSDEMFTAISTRKTLSFIDTTLKEHEIQFKICQLVCSVFSYILTEEDWKYTYVPAASKCCNSHLCTKGKFTNIYICDYIKNVQFLNFYNALQNIFSLQGTIPTSFGRFKMIFADKIEYSSTQEISYGWNSCQLFHTSYKSNISKGQKLVTKVVATGRGQMVVTFFALVPPSIFH